MTMLKVLFLLFALAASTNQQSFVPLAEWDAALEGSSKALAKGSTQVFDKIKGLGSLIGRKVSDARAQFQSIFKQGGPHAQTAEKALKYVDTLRPEFGGPVGVMLIWTARYYQHSSHLNISDDHRIRKLNDHIDSFWTKTQSKELTQKGDYCAMKKVDENIKEMEKLITKCYDEKASTCSAMRWVVAGALGFSALCPVVGGLGVLGGLGVGVGIGVGGLPLYDSWYLECSLRDGYHDMLTDLHLDILELKTEGHFDIITKPEIKVKIDLQGTPPKKFDYLVNLNETSSQTMMRLKLNPDNYLMYYGEMLTDPTRPLKDYCIGESQKLLIVPQVGGL